MIQKKCRYIACKWMLVSLMALFISIPSFASGQKEIMPAKPAMTETAEVETGNTDRTMEPPQMPEAPVVPQAEKPALDPPTPPQREPKPVDPQPVVPPEPVAKPASIQTVEKEPPAEIPPQRSVARSGFYLGAVSFSAKTTTLCPLGLIDSDQQKNGFIRQFFSAYKMGKSDNNALYQAVNDVAAHLGTAISEGALPDDISSINIIALSAGSDNDSKAGALSALQAVFKNGITTSTGDTIPVNPYIYNIFMNPARQATGVFALSEGNYYTLQDEMQKLALSFSKDRSEYGSIVVYFVVDEGRSLGPRGIEMVKSSVNAVINQLYTLLRSR
jgi:hypothetical protein